MAHPESSWVINFFPLVSVSGIEGTGEEGNYAEYFFFFFCCRFFWQIVKWMSTRQYLTLNKPTLNSHIYGRVLSKYFEYFGTSVLKSLRTKILSTCPLPLTCSLQLLPTTQLYAKNPMLIVAQELLIGHQHHFQLGMFIIQPFNISQKS